MGEADGKGIKDLKSQTSKSKHLDFILLDLLCVEISYILANLVRFGFGGAPDGEIFATMNLLLVLIHLVGVFMLEPYSGILRRGYGKEFKNVLLHSLCVLAFAMLVLFFLQASERYSRLMLLYFFVFNLIIMYGVRLFRKKYLLKANNGRAAKQNMILVTYFEEAKGLIEGLQSYNYNDFTLCGVCILDIDYEGKSIEGIPVVANRKNLPDYVKSNVVDAVFLKCTEEERKKYTDLFYHMGVRVHICMDFFLDGIPNVVMGNINGYTVLTATMHRMTFRQRVIKRAMDICGGIVGIVVTCMIFVVFGPIIYIQSPGPILFRQLRVGQHGRKFYIYKFRSMYPDAEARKAELMKENQMSGHMFKMDNDPRIIPIGKFMRKTSLDEFPQFFNVLKGDMSLVGTRPPTVDEYEKYELHHKSRLAIKPGITGMWQVSGRSDITDFEEVVKLDNQYIRSFCLSLDIKILLKTVFGMFFGKGAK